MVDNFNGWQQDFNVLILECFEPGINVSINTPQFHVISLTQNLRGYYGR